MFRRSRKSIKAVKVYDDMILIYLSGITAYIIPTRYLSAESQNSIIKELGTYWGEAKR